MRYYLSAFLLLLLIAGCSTATVQRPVITYKVHGGFIDSPAALRMLTVAPANVTLTVASENGTVISSVTRPLNASRYREIAGLAGNLSSYDASYGSPVPDRGYATISSSAGGNVTLYGGKLPSSLDALQSALQELLSDAQMLTPAEAETLAQGWIRKSPTYAYDGANLSMKDENLMAGPSQQYVLTFAFTSAHAGYGDRAGQATAEALTPHMIVVTVEDGIVTSAVIDGRWDALHQRLLQAGGLMQAVIK